MMPVITLLTDFGIDDAYVGIMKGVILSVNSCASIVDITHHVEPQNIVQASYIIQSSYIYFPEGTVHIVVVDPGVGSDRAILAVKKDNHFFLAPDNGILAPLIENKGADSIIRVTNPDYFLDSVSQTFHGRDIFAPVGAYLSKGINIKQLGHPVDQKKILKLNVKRPLILNEGLMSGEIVSVDRFGNLITNIDSGLLNKICAPGRDKAIEIRIGNKKIKGLANTYGCVKRKIPIAIIGSGGYLEIAVNCGSASSYFLAKTGDEIFVAAT
jgi:S-adenosylmethionine hydrolase